MSVLKNIVISISVFIIFISSLTCYADVAVKGYYRKNGTYVKPHMRSNPDSSFKNNWSTVGNINPYTGKVGTKTASTYNTYSSMQAPITPIVDNKSVPLLDLSNYLDDNNISESRNSNLYASENEAYNSIVIPDYGTPSLNSLAKIKVNGTDWYQIAESRKDIAYVRKGMQGYFNNYPVVSIMYKGAMQPNKLPAWLGTRFMKVIVDCREEKVALIADAIIDSNGNIVRDIDYPRNTRVNWNNISNMFDASLFKSTTKICGF